MDRTNAVYLGALAAFAIAAGAQLTFEHAGVSILALIGCLMVLPGAFGDFLGGEQRAE